MLFRLLRLLLLHIRAHHAVNAAHRTDLSTPAYQRGDDGFRDGCGLLLNKIRNWFIRINIRPCVKVLPNRRAYFTGHFFEDFIPEQLTRRRAGFDVFKEARCPHEFLGHNFSHAVLNTQCQSFRR